MATDERGKNPRLIAAGIAAAIAIVAAIAVTFTGGSNDSAETDDSSTVTTSTTATPSTDETEATTPTNTETATPDSTPVAPVEPKPGQIVLVDSSVEGPTGIVVNYSLIRDDMVLCFAARLTHADSATAATLGNGVDDCLDDGSPLTTMTRDLSASVAPIDGDRQFAVLWGRTTTEVVRLELRFIDGTTIDIDVVADDLGINVFAVVIDTTQHGEATTLDAIDSNGTVIDSEPVRGFHRAGPTYAVVTPSTTPPPTYPTTPDS